MRELKGIWVKVDEESGPTKVSIEPNSTISSVLRFCCLMF